VSTKPTKWRMSGRNVLLASFATLFVSIGSSVNAEEGLFRRGEIPLPAPIRDAIPSVVRVVTKIAFDVQIFADQAALKANTALHPEREKKIFLKDGVSWPVDMTFEDTASLCAGPTRDQPGNAEICAGFKRNSCVSRSCRFVTDRLAGSASGFVVGRTSEGDLLVMTAYHVAREGIERLGRTGGVYAAHPCPVPDMEVQLSDKGQRHPVSIIANASAEDWRNGRDWALLEVLESRDTVLPALPLAAARATAAERVWVVGFPTRTDRQLTLSSTYRNASDELRISVGNIVAQPAEIAAADRDDTFADADGVAGNSGSPALNAKGEVVGLFRAHTFYQAGEDLRLTQFGGLAQLTPASILAQGFGAIARH
jgi:S1-C subfamily serine protease